LQAAVVLAEGRVKALVRSMAAHGDPGIAHYGTRRRGCLGWPFDEPRTVGRELRWAVVGADGLIYRPVHKRRMESSSVEEWFGQSRPADTSPVAYAVVFVGKLDAILLANNVPLPDRRPSRVVPETSQAEKHGGSEGPLRDAVEQVAEGNQSVSPNAGFEHVRGWSDEDLAYLQSVDDAGGADDLTEIEHRPRDDEILLDGLSPLPDYRGTGNATAREVCAFDDSDRGTLLDNLMTRQTTSEVTDSVRVERDELVADQTLDQDPGPRTMSDAVADKFVYMAITDTDRATALARMDADSIEMLFDPGPVPPQVASTQVSDPAPEFLESHLVDEPSPTEAKHTPTFPPAGEGENGELSANSLTRRRMGQIIEAILVVLVGHREGLDPDDVIALTEKRLFLTPFEHAGYPDRPDLRRFDKNVKFAAIGLTKARWITIDQGRWQLTAEGIRMIGCFDDPADLARETIRLYRAWKRTSQPQPTKSAASQPGPAIAPILAPNAAEETALADIEVLIRRLRTVLQQTHASFSQRPDRRVDY
jgi:hypothetical protein